MRYLIFFMHFWAVLWHPRRSLISSQIFCQIFLASLLSSRSKFSAQSWTRIFCSSLVHVSYDFLPVLVDSRDSKTVGGDGELDTLSPSVGVKKRLVDDDGDGVGELCKRPSPRRFISQIGRKIYRKKRCLKPIRMTWPTIHVERLNAFSWFSRAFP